MKEITLEGASQWGNAEYMKEGLILMDGTINVFQPEGPNAVPHTKQQVPVRLNFIVMALCQQGQAQYSINTRKLTVKAGELLFISERHIIDEFEATPDFSCICFMVSTDFYHSFVQNVKNVSSLLLFSRNYPVVELTQEESSVFSNFYQAIRMKMEHTTHHYRTELIKTLLLAMFYDMSNVIWRVGQKKPVKMRRGDAIFEQFIRLVEEHYRTERRVSWYADQLNISGKYLSEIIKQVSRRTPNQWIDDYVVLEIRVMLKNTTKSVRDIAQELNFANQSFLGKYFKEHVGMSPTEFRKQ